VNIKHKIIDLNIVFYVNVDENPNSKRTYIEELLINQTTVLQLLS
jgi:hypothetical protein